MNYGIHSYFKKLLKVEVSNSPFIVSCFVKSLNKKTQNYDLDLHDQYRDVNNESLKRFWTRSLMGHSTHKDILENFESCVEGLDVTKMA